MTFRGEVAFGVGIYWRPGAARHGARCGAYTLRKVFGTWKGGDAEEQVTYGNSVGVRVRQCARVIS